MLPCEVLCEAIEGGSIDRNNLLAILEAPMAQVVLVLVRISLSVCD